MDKNKYKNTWRKRKSGWNLWLHVLPTIAEWALTQKHKNGSWCTELITPHMHMLNQTQS
jgi:hypothetical protein